MSQWNELAQWLYGDVQAGRGFWYSHPLREIEGLTDEQLFRVPDENCLCALWHVGHIAHREQTHIETIIQGHQGIIVPPRYEVFGTEWCSVDKVRESIDSVSGVLSWAKEVRRKSTDFIATLRDEDFCKKPPTADGLSIGHWVFITVSHGALHIGKIQMLRAMMEKKHDRPC